MMYSAFVMRRPPDPKDKVFVEAPDAAKVLDLANAQYGLMLSCPGFRAAGARYRQRFF